VIINPFDGVVEKKILVADGLKELAFSRDYTKAYIANVVDVSNRLTVLDAQSYLEEDEIEVSGVPQGIGVFPDNHKLAIILGSKTDFMAGGFDVLDLNRQSKADPKQKYRYYRERELRLTHKIAVGDDGDRIYCIDAKSSLINIFSLASKRKINEVDLHGAPEEMLYPYVGDFYYVSVLSHNAIYQLSKKRDKVVAVYTYDIRQPGQPASLNRLRYLAVDRDARYMYATNYERHSVAIWRLGDLSTSVKYEKIPLDPGNERYYRWPAQHFLPIKRFLLKGGYDPSKTYVPGGNRIAVDPANEYLYVMDDNGGFYIYELREIMKAKELATPEPHKLVVLGSGVEVRDLKVSRPAVRGRNKEGGA
jgi:DNA-binding beta-propeller fold protein YncE